METGKRCILKHIRVREVTTPHSTHTTQLQPQQLIKLCISGDGISGPMGPIEVYIDAIQYKEEYTSVSVVKKNKSIERGAEYFSSYCTGESYGSNNNSNSNPSSTSSHGNESSEYYDLFCKEFNVGIGLWKNGENSNREGKNVNFSTHSQCLKILKVIWMKKNSV